MSFWRELHFSERSKPWGAHPWALRPTERIIAGSAPRSPAKRHSIVGITRVRNEMLLLADTLDHVGRDVDAIVAYDDASTDETLDILLNHPKVAVVIANGEWEPEAPARLAAETRHRGMLLQTANDYLTFDWVYCFDADERHVGDLRSFVAGADADGCRGVRLQLFDAYMTPDDHEPFVKGHNLLNFRKSFGPERRDILMLWRNATEVHFEGLDAREPRGVTHVETRFHCQHYGKALSIAHWEQTCDYYVRHFPFETYGRKWMSRKGKSIHSRSDFNRPLYEWGEELFRNAVTLT